MILSYNLVSYTFAILLPTAIAQFSQSNSVTENIGYGVRRIQYPLGVGGDKINTLQTAMNCFFVPGWITGSLMIDSIGAKKTTSIMFFRWAITGFALVGIWSQIPNNLPQLVFLYGNFQALGQTGPPSAALRYDSESISKQLNRHLLGFAAIVGMSGVVVGSQASISIQVSYSDPLQGQQLVYLVGAIVALVGFLASCFFGTDFERWPSDWRDLSEGLSGRYSCTSNTSKQSSEKGVSISALKNKGV